MTTDRIRAASRANHEAHDCADQDVMDSFDYLAGPNDDKGGEIEELYRAVRHWWREPSSETAAAVVAEVADCLIVLDWIVDLVTHGAVISAEAVECKVAADRVKLARRAEADGMVAG